MLTDTQFDFIRALPVEIRLQLLHADPDGAGFYFKTWNRDEMLEAHSDASEAIHENLHRYGDREKPQSHAWIPRNPLAVIEVAARIFGKRHGLTPSIELLGPDETDGWTCRIVVAGNVSVMAAGGRDEIGVLTLREVCRG